MTDRSTAIRQGEATRLFKAAKAAGFNKARFIDHPDGRREFVGESAPVTPESKPLSPFKQWEANNEDKA